jgi:hypothetical protein
MRGGGIFQNSRPKNAKNHAISVLQMQEFPQYNIMQEIRFFVPKIAKRNRKSL